MHIWSGIVLMGRALGVGVCKGKLESKNKMKGRGGEREKFFSIHLAQRALCLVSSTGSQAAEFTGKEGMCSLLGYNHLFDYIIDYTASLL